MEHKFELVGPNAGKTVNLGGYNFVDGVHIHESVYDQVPGITRYLAVSYNAHPVGSEALTTAQGIFDGTIKEEINAPESEREPERTAPPGANQTLTAAIQGLDPAKDGDWTAQGLPSVEAVVKAFGREVTRADIDKAAPSYNRAAAKAAAAALG